MCILAVATAGSQFTRDTLEDMFHANSDGGGWAYAKNGKIYFSKGYTNVNKFIKAVMKLPVDVERMVHCRIGTHGGITKELTHPFPVSRDYRVMERLNGTMSSGYILAHNGILSNFSPASNHSDTEELVRCLANVRCDLMGEDLREMINTLVKGSRVAILNTSGKINRYGTGWTFDNGIWYSNTLFKYSTRKYYNYSAWDEWDEWDGYYNSYKNSTPASKSSSIPSIDELVPLAEGEVVKITDTKKAYLNGCDGSYMLDKKTNKLYGHYKGALYSTRYERCPWCNWSTCSYDCPFRKSGDGA